MKVEAPFHICAHQQYENTYTKEKEQVLTSVKTSEILVLVSSLLYALLDPIREPAKCFKFSSDRPSCDVQHISFNKRHNRFKLDFI